MISAMTPIIWSAFFRPVDLTGRLLGASVASGDMGIEPRTRPKFRRARDGKTLNRWRSANAKIVTRVYELPPVTTIVLDFAG
jgi:hypothetical protein